VVTHQLQVERRTGKVRRPETDVLPLCHATNSLLLLQQPFNGLFSRTTWVSRYQKGKTNLDFTGARDSEWQWQQLGQLQVCTSLQTDNHASTPPLCFFTGGMPFLLPNQQRQSTEGTTIDFCSVSVDLFCQHLKTFLFSACFPDIIIDNP